MIVVIGGQLLISLLFVRYLFLQNLILATFAVTNVISVNLVLNETFIGLPGYGLVLSILFVFFILWVFMNALNESSRAAKILITVYGLATLGALGQTLYSDGSIPQLPSEIGRTSAENIRLVDFETKPNVYFIGFDSI